MSYNNDITSSDLGNGYFSNPVILADVPDVDFIRVDKTYYMISTTMHLSPGCPVMRSFDLVNWEIIGYVFDTLGDDDCLRLECGLHNYGKGQWAPTMRYHNGVFYVGFMSYATGKTYIYHTTDIEKGQWEKITINECFHDMSLLFDDDRVFVVYGGGQIWCAELKADLSGIIEGTKRIIIKNAGLVDGCLAEGAHIYKIDGFYYLFIITWPPNSRRIQLCYRAKSIDGEWERKVILDDNMGFHNAGVAQGGIIDTHDGRWYSILFQDHGAVGRAPVLIPMKWEDGWPCIGEDKKAPKIAQKPFECGEKKGIVCNDDFDEKVLSLCWQFNHNPENDKWSLTDREGHLRLYSATVCDNVTRAKNTISQRTFGDRSSAIIKLDVKNLRDGDMAGFSAFAEKYGLVAVEAAGERKYIKMARFDDNKAVMRELEMESHELLDDTVYLRIDCDFENSTDKAYFYYSYDEKTWIKIGDTLQMNYYGLHFMGYRFAIFCYSQKAPGGWADIDFFKVSKELLITSKE